MLTDDVLKDLPDVAEVWRKSPGTVHMTGIGGVGMAGLALLLQRVGWTVSGCDAYDGPLLTWLRGKGIACAVGHNPQHVESKPDLIVRSPAVQLEEPELRQARDLRIPVVSRGRLLPLLLKNYTSIAVAGTHGKTTTASMIAWILDRVGESTSFCIGGICPGLDAVARAEAGGFMVVEADESDGTLRHYAVDIAVITSMDLDHVDFFAEASSHVQTFSQFARQSGKLIYSGEDALAIAAAAGHPAGISFGISAAVDVRATDIELGAQRSVFTAHLPGRPPANVVLGVTGQHNVLNALAALAAVDQAGVDLAKAVVALSGFQLPRRRFEVVAKGRGITVISDYAHHPVEIAALLAQARLLNPRRILAVFQPHRYSRTKAFRKEFADVLRSVDELILAPVYAASEPFLEGGTSDDLVPLLVERGMKELKRADSVADAWAKVQATWRKGDLVLVIGAGDVDFIGKWAAAELADTKG